MRTSDLNSSQEQNLNESFKSQTSCENKLDDTNKIQMRKFDL